MFGWKEKRGRGTPRMAETSAALDGLLITGQAGFLKGTHVASNLGWRAVDTLSVGDRVLTFDHAMQPIVDIQRETLIMPERDVGGIRRPVLVPDGALFNRRELWLMPDQGMLIECDAAQDAVGDPFAVVPARMLSGLRGITLGYPGEQIEVTTIGFNNDEVIYVEGGMLAHCPRPQPLYSQGGNPAEGIYDVLSGPAAQFLVNCIIDDDDALAVASDPAELPGGFHDGPVRPSRPVRSI